MRISHSGRGVYSECGYKFFLHYFLKLRSTIERSPLIFGNSVDLGLNALLEHRDIIKAQAEFFVSWNKINPETVVFSKSDLEDHLLTDEELKIKSVQKRSWISLREKGRIMLDEFNAQVMPNIGKVIKIQLEDTVKNADGDELIAKGDLICEWGKDKRIILFDNKTSSVPYAVDSVRTSEQLAVYMERFAEEYKVEAAGYIVLPKKINKKKKPAIDIKVIIDQVDEKTTEATFKSFQDTLDGIKAGKFEKNWNSCQNHFGKCQYYDYCRTGNKKGLCEKKDK